MQVEPVASPLEREMPPGQNFQVPHGLRGTVALLEEQGVVAAEICCHREGLSVERFARQRLEPKDENLQNTPEDLVQGLAQAIETGGFSRKGLVIALPDFLFSLDIITLPPVEKKNLEAIIGRKVLRTQPAGGANAYWCYEILEERKSGTDRGVKVVVARIPAPLLNRIHSSLERHRIKATVLTLPLMGVMNLIRTMDPEAGRGSLLVLNVSSTGVTLSVFVDRILRQIRFLKAKVLPEKERFNSILHVEVQRTIAFHKEKHKGESIERILIMGSQAGCVDLKSGPLPIQATLSAHEPAVLRQGPGSQEEKESPAEDGLLALFTGLLLAKRKEARKSRRHGDAGINFTSPPKRFALFASAMAAVLVLALFGIFSMANFLYEKNRAHAQYLKQLQEGTAPLGKLIAKRDTLLALEKYCQKLKTVCRSAQEERRDVAETMLAIRHSLPSGVNLSSMLYSPGEGANGLSPSSGRIGLELEGDFTGCRSTQLENFVRALRSTGLFLDIFFHTSGAVQSSLPGGGMSEKIDLEMTLK